MIIKSAEFLCSNTDYTKCPSPHMPEYAMIGRSNVGKSSLTNMILGRKSLAKTSSTPGKTQLINHFLVNESWYMVDLPGYGWASVGKEKKVGFSKMNTEYLMNRPNLQCLFVLIDSRLEPQAIDLEFIRWLGKSQVPFVLIFTKADKQTVLKTTRSVELFKTTLLEEWEELPTIFISSSVSGLGKDEILRYITGINKDFKFVYS
jgi:GTP-binding protein